jgi:hypothetical protein
MGSSESEEDFLIFACTTAALVDAGCEAWTFVMYRIASEIPQYTAVFSTPAYGLFCFVTRSWFGP